MQVVGTDIGWELDIALPELKGALKVAGRQDELKTAGHLAAHAPASLHPDGAQRWERTPSSPG
jgi:hypothetical protein